MSDPTYVGDELGLFAEATRWKAYYKSMVRPYLGRRVLEVGAGIGGTTAVLCEAEQDLWLCLERDPELLEQIDLQVSRGELPRCCSTATGTLEDLDREELFDAVLYIDVLEHVEDDGAEAKRAAERLAPGGCLVVVAPAHGWLFTPFDEAIGHYRRYTRRTLDAAVPDGLERVCLRYLDAVGMLASSANRWLLSQSMPTRRQLWVWDKWMVPLSRLIDPLLGYRVGKSVLGVWRRPRLTQPPLRSR